MCLVCMRRMSTCWGRERGGILLAGAWWHRRGFNAAGISIAEPRGPGLLSCFVKERLAAGDDGAGTA